MAILALQISPLLTIVEQTGLLTVNVLTSLLTLLTLEVISLLILLEHTALTSLHWYQRLTVPLTLDKTSVLLAVTWLLPFTDIVSSLKEKEIVAEIICLETSVYMFWRDVCLIVPCSQYWHYWFGQSNITLPNKM